MADSTVNATQQLAEKILRDSALLQQLSDRVYKLLQDDLRFQAERIGLKGDRPHRFL